jgi:NAD(P)-dependent dehydrogenase (short-subunit alcohol dehydrogenase family)
MLLKDKVAVITGAGSGIGQATALLLGKEGAKVATLDPTPEKSQKTIDQIKQAGGEAMITTADISYPEQVQQSMDKIAQLVLFLVSDASNHITGTEVWIDGGQSLLQG